MKRIASILAASAMLISCGQASTQAELCADLRAVETEWFNNEIRVFDAVGFDALENLADSAQSYDKDEVKQAGKELQALVEGDDAAMLLVEVSPQQVAVAVGHIQVECMGNTVIDGSYDPDLSE